MSETATLSSDLRSLSSFKWTTGGRITGTIRGQSTTFNPLTALARSKGHGTFRDTKRTTIQAGRKLGYSAAFSEQVYNACVGTTNRGYTQILRGKIGRAIGLG
jgi:hypothetical protein